MNGHIPLFPVIESGLAVLKCKASFYDAMVENQACLTHVMQEN